MQQIGFRLIRQIERPPVDVVERLAAYRSCDLSDAMRKAGTMVGIMPVFTPIPSAVGPAITVSIPAGGINMIKAAMELARDGDVLVVNAQGNTSYASWGGNVSLGVQSRGVRGLVIDGAVRDVSEIRALQFSVWARGSATAAGAVDAPAGEVNVPIACGGVVVHPGDLVVADEDGIVVVPSSAADDVMAAADALLARFEALQPTLRAGGVTSIDSIMAEFRARGLQEID